MTDDHDAETRRAIDAGERPASPEAIAAMREALRHPITRRSKAKAHAQLVEIVRARGRTYHANVRAPASRKRGGANSHGDALREQNTRLFEAERARSPSLSPKQLCTRAYALIVLDRNRSPRRLLECKRTTLTAHVAKYLNGAVTTAK